MTLRQMLNQVDFDAELDENGEIRLIDLQGAYLGDIGDCRYKADKSSIPFIVDRLEIYWNDYFLKPYCGSLEISDDISYEELLRELENGADKYKTGIDIIKNIVNPEFVELDEDLRR